MVKRLFARACCFNEHLQIGARLFLADELAELLGTQ